MSEGYDNTIWLDIKGYEGKYQASNSGFIKSLERWVDSGQGGKPYLIKERILKAVPDKDRYLQVALSKDGKLTTKKVHRLIAECFIDNPENLKEVNHKNKDVTNNGTDNIEWCDRITNVRHQYSSIFRVMNPEGEVLEGYNIKKFALDNGLHPRLLGDLLNNSQKTHRGWKKVYYKHHSKGEI